MMKRITYDRSTGDFFAELDGEFAGYYPAYADAEEALNALAYDRQARGMEVPEVPEVEEAPTSEWDALIGELIEAGLDPANALDAAHDLLGTVLPAFAAAWDHRAAHMRQQVECRTATVTE